MSAAIDILNIGQDTAWMTDGACNGANPEWFFADSGGIWHKAVKVCAACPVKDTCLEYALDNEEEYGIWGGLTETKRRQLIRQQRSERECSEDGCESARALRDDGKGYRRFCVGHVALHEPAGRRAS